MKNWPDYGRLDQQPMLAQYLLFPRADHTPPPPGAFDLMVPVEPNRDIEEACRFYSGQAEWPWMLYFHGNGEVASDYDYIYRMYHAHRINLVVADYRGYGMSSGYPNFRYLARDAQVLYGAVREELSRRNYLLDLWIMGRSLGSMSALELAAHYQEEVQGLIIESGFASVTRLARQWGLPVDLSVLLSVEEQCLAMIRTITLPALVIHGQVDSLVSPREGRLIYETLGSSQKRWLPIPGADHNDIMIVDPQKYFTGIGEFVSGA